MIPFMISINDRHFLLCFQYPHDSMDMDYTGQFIIHVWWLSSLNKPGNHDIAKQIIVLLNTNKSKFVFICAWLRIVVSNTCFYLVFLHLVYHMLPISLDFPFLIAPSVFSNVSLLNCWMDTTCARLLMPHSNR